MIRVYNDLTGFDPANGERVPHFHIANIIRLLNRIEMERSEIQEKALKPGGSAKAWERAHEMQNSLEVAYGHALRLQEIIQEKDQPNESKESPSVEIQNKSTEEMAQAHFSDLYNRLGRSKDPTERVMIAHQLARIIFGC